MISVNFASTEPLIAAPGMLSFAKSRRLAYIANFTDLCPEMAPPGWHLYVGTSVPAPSIGDFDEAVETDLLLDDLRDTIEVSTGGQGFSTSQSLVMVGRRSARSQGSICPTKPRSRGGCGTSATRSRSMPTAAPLPVRKPRSSWPTRSLPATARRCAVDMSETLKRLCAWSGPATVAVALVGWLIAGVLPLPLGSSSTTDEVVAFYGHDTRVLIGLVIAQLGVCLVFPLIALITLAMLRIEGRTPPLLTIIQAVTGAATGVLLLMPMLLMAVIAFFRPDRTPPELTVTLNDIAWLLFLTPIAPFMIQNIAIGTAILGGDKRSLLPRWVGYFNFWVAAAFIPPDVLAFFFHDGAFSWRGVFVFWLALFAYAAFLIVMGVVLRNADLDTRTES